MDELQKQMQALADRIQAIDTEQAGIIERSKAQNSGKFTDADRATFDQLDKERADKVRELNDAKADYQRQQNFAGRAKIDTNLPRRSEAGASAPVITRQKEAVADDPSKGFKEPREFFSAVMESSRQGRVADDRLKHCLHAAVGSDEHQTGSDPYGGFTVPKGFLPTIMQVPAEVDPIAGRTTSIPMESPIIKITARVDKNHSTSVSGGLRVYRREETQEATASRMVLEEITMHAHSLFGAAYASEELLARSRSSFVALIQNGFREEFGAHIVNERLNGTGVGEYLGILNSPATVVVSKDNSQTNDTITYSNVINMRSRCWRYGQAIWLANHDTLPQLMQLSQAVGTAGGQVVWQPSAREDHPDLLLGRPIYFTEYANTLGDKGDLILANWSQYLEGTLTGLQSAESIHVRFLNHERTFKLWMENDGRPWWTSPLTPKNSTNTLSPFVVLEAR